MRHQLLQDGWRTSGREAIATRKGSTSGRVHIGSRAHLLVSETFQNGSQEDPSKPCTYGGDNWHLTKIRLRGLTVVLVVVYFHTGQGAGGQNLTQLQEIGRVVATLGTPFVKGADWQMEPSQLQGTGWLHMLGASVVHAPMVDTQHTAGKGRVIDFFVCSNPILPMMGIDRDNQSPWKTHPVLLATMSARPRQIKFLAQVKAKAFPEGPGTTMVTWQEAKQMRKAVNIGQPNEVLEQHLRDHPKGEICAEDWQTGRRWLSFGVRADARYQWPSTTASSGTAFTRGTTSHPW
jgi:hypothetical protein